MAIKRAPIIEAYQVNMYCDKCGKIMKYTRGTFDCNPPLYSYVCECGHTATSIHTLPCQQVIFDASKLEEVEL